MKYVFRNKPGLVQNLEKSLQAMQMKAAAEKSSVRLTMKDV
ncbi:hypothetical protein PC116_g9410 [Phytophthora cactorum]|nr:hypothetical protein PC114_g15799 [Phytophthora cactorum]KAG3166487.1 hypothetical protein C6341_g12031 [Phytophthora cactorum]KAG4242673.1 hypothetical protein PC116_g9410 [Phytophthora cactorum]